MKEPKRTKLRNKKTCYDCGKQYSEYIWSPFWCPECDEKRVKRIRGSLENMVENFKKEQP